MSILPDSCLGCKGCCTNMGVNILDSEDILFPIEMTQTTITPKGRPLRWMKRKTNGECIALDSDTGHCTIYSDRPQVCKDFERGLQDCLDALGRL